MMKPARRPTTVPSPVRSSLLVLEPRIMFDAAGGAELLDALLTQHVAEQAAEADHVTTLLAGAGEANELAVAPVQVVFVAPGLGELGGFAAGSEVVRLQAGSDLLQQMAAYLQNRQGVAAIHILSHGQAGQLMLGDVTLTAANLSQYQAQLSTLGQSLLPGGDILLYGCSIAAGADGQALIQRLASFTGADIAASNDATGAASLGGDWVLESKQGEVNTDALALAYDALLARPITGTTDFTASDGNVYNPSGSVVNASPVQGWDFSLQLGSTNNGGQTIIVEKAGSVTTETVDGYSDGTIPISYLSVKSNDNSRFTLNSIGVVLNGYNSGTLGGNLQLVGYTNGTAVSGANLTLNVGDVLQGSGGLVTFNVSGNAAFRGIDSFRVMAAGGNNVTGMIGIGAINAIDFGYAPTLTSSGGASAFSAGSGAAVVVDSGITLTDSDSGTQASATVSITGNFQSAEDVLAFSNTNSTTYGNIAASYNSGTGVLTLTSSGGSATLAQWQAALRAVTYQDSSLSPNTGSRTISFAINDGAINSAVVTKTVTLTANAAPVLSNLAGDSTTFTEKGSAVLLDTGSTVSISDGDTSNFNGGSLTVSITANGQSGQDVLGISTGGTVSLSSGTSVGSTVSVGGVAVGVIAANGDGSGGHNLIVTLNSNATAARMSTLVAALTYQNSSTTDPATATRTINISLNDGRGGTGSSNVSVALAAVNDAPTGTATGNTPTLSAGGAAVSLFASASFSTVESSQSISQLVFTVTGLADGSSEILAIDGSNVALTNGNSVTTVGNGVSVSVSVSGSTATVTLVSGAGLSTSTIAGIVNGMTYRDSSASPTAGNRVITLGSIKDNGGTANGGVDTSILSLAATVNVLAAGPSIGLSGGSAAFVSGDNTSSTPIAVDSAITVADPASPTIASGTVAITGNFQSGQDVLAYTNNGSTMGNISGSYNAATGVLTLTSSGATATLAQWQAALRAVTYTSTAISPNTATRTISLQINDGSNSSTVVTRSISVTATAQTPILTASAGSAAFTAADNAASTPVVVDSGLTVADLDSSAFSSAQVSISGNFQSTQDSLAFSNTSASAFGNISASYNAATGVLTLSSSGATATLAQWRAALQAVTYGNSAITPNTATRTISFTLNDGSKTSAAVTRTVTVAATDQTPVVTASGGSAAFVSGDNTASTAVAIDAGLVLSDLDSTTLSTARVSIAANFQSAEDVLAFSNTNATTYGNIAASYNSATGVLTLTSSGATATLAQWQAALRAVTYTDTAITPVTASRTISVVVSDGSKDSAQVTRTITVTATAQTPVVTGSGGSASFVLGGGAIVVDSGVTLSDRDSATLASATVSVSGSFQAGEDVLAFSNTNSSTFGNISASYNAGTGVLTLTSAGASATLAQWQAALRAVSYTDTAITPNTTNRTISFSVNDGAVSSSIATRSVTMQLPTPTIAGLTIATDTGSSNSDGQTSNATPTVTGSAQAGSTVTVYIDGNAAGTTTASGLGAWSFNIPSALASGSHAITVRAAVGSVNSAQSSAYSVTIDTTAPTAPAISGLSAGSDSGSSASDGITNQTTPTVQGSAEAGSTVTIYVDGNAVGTATANGSGAWSYTLATALGSGSHSLRATSTDSSGNVSAQSSAYSVTIDTTAPGAPAISGLSAGSDSGSSASDGITNQTTPTVQGSAEAGSTVTIYVDGNAVGTATANGSGAWSYTLPTALGSGSHSLRATSTDSSGNVSAQSSAYSVTIDTTAPSAPAISGLSAGSDSGSSASDGITNQTTPTVQGSAEAGSTVTIYVDGNAVGTATANGSGAWSYTLPTALGSGSHSLRATSTDSSGNVSAQSSAYSVTIDTTAPTATVVLLDANPSSNSALRYQIIFAEEVEDIPLSAFSLAGEASGVLAGVQRLDGKTYLVSVANAAGSGDLLLRIDGNSVRDKAGNAVAGTVSGRYTLLPVVVAPDNLPPVVSSDPALVQESVASSQTVVLASVSDSDAASRASLPLYGSEVLGLPQTLVASTGVQVIAVEVNERQAQAIEVRIAQVTQSIALQQSFSFTLPQGTFSVRSGSSLSLEARQSNGQPLPAWVRFDPVSGQFSGQLPAGFTRPLDIVVTVRDSQGNQGVARIKLDPGGNGNTGEAPAQRSATSPVSRARPDVAPDGKPALVEQLAQQGSKGFGQAVNALLHAAAKVVTREG